jgi:hypothetical protein
LIEVVEIEKRLCLTDTKFERTRNLAKRIGGKEWNQCVLTCPNGNGKLAETENHLKRHIKATL